MAKQTISILISTLNRPHQLARCLESLSKQTIMPYEVIVVDNGPSDETRNICRAYTSWLPLRYVTEKRRGLSYGRNKGISLVRGQICAFIDDDCVAYPRWIAAIQKNFQMYDSTGVIGFNRPMNPFDIPGCVEDVFLYRRYLQSVPSLNKVCKLNSSTAIDFKNAAFLSQFIKKYRFDTNILLPYEDVEMGVRLYQDPQLIYFNPSILVSHENSLTYSALFKKNYIRGYATQAYKNQLKSHNKVSLYVWYKYIVKTLISLKGVQNKIVFLFVLLLYPWFSRFGRLSHVLHHK